MRDAQGAALRVASGSPLRVWIPLEGARPGAMLARRLDIHPIFKETRDPSVNR
jgi:hypothetical protein